ncbi:unnamed protein product [Amoebophrya sp. A25]|nr:unnamed protein product [Amoebophrya sp. A25]|eukprot:GSA25T00016607001.1
MKSKVLSSSHVFSCLSSWHNVQNSLADYLASSSSSEQVRRALYRTLDEVFSANVVPELNAQIPSGKFKNIDDCVANLVVKYYGNTRNVITKIGPEEENETLQESASDRMVERTAKLRNLAVEAASIASGKTQGTSATEKAALILKRLELLLQKGMKIDDIISGKSRRERKLAFSI